MKIVDQYVEAVGQNLPFRGRSDIKLELRSLLLDQIESEYGETPALEDVKRVITGFGSPASVAAGYSGRREPISRGLSSLYFLIIKIIPFAMLVAFTVIFVMDVIFRNLSGGDFFRAFGQNFLNAVNGAVSGIGMVTIIFIVITRFGKKGVDDKEDSWSVDELESITLENGAESTASTIVGIVFLSILIVLVALAPQILSFAEESFLKSGLSLGHRINISVFRGWSVFLCLIWGEELIISLITLRTGKRGRGLKIYGMILSLFTILLMSLMLADKNLYLNDSGYIGFKLVFLIVLIVSAAEMIGEAGKFILSLISRE
ncbi:MAG: hypothetical protein JEY99_00860 [Spirochaetales bacterium]|nr:hypothetical protein [Spirochaetales bacterium]